jgi:hypothetical protein
MIRASAIRLGYQTIWSENFGTGQVYDRLMVRNPFCSLELIPVQTAAPRMRHAGFRRRIFDCPSSSVEK